MSCWQYTKGFSQSRDTPGTPKSIFCEHKRPFLGTDGWVISPTTMARPTLPSTSPSKSCNSRDPRQSHCGKTCTTCCKPGCVVHQGLCQTSPCDTVWLYEHINNKMICYAMTVKRDCVYNRTQRSN